MTLHTHPPPPAKPHKLNIRHISAVTRVRRDNSFWNETKNRLIKTYCETETEKKWMLFFVQDETETRLSNILRSKTRLNSTFQGRPRQDKKSLSLFLHVTEMKTNHSE